MNYKRVSKAALLLVVLTSVGCEEDAKNIIGPTTPPPVEQFAFVTTTDYQTGSASVVWLDSTYTTEKDVASIHSDAIARYFDGLIYVVNRFGADNIQILDPAKGFATARQFTVGNGADPHDIVVLRETKAYVTRYNRTDLWVVDPSTGTKTGSVDLSVFADGDGIPEMDHLLLMGDHLFVSVQRIDRDTWRPVGMSYLAVVDVSADTLLDVTPATTGTQAIALAATNPFSDVKVDTSTGNLYVACAGEWGTADSGVEAVNPTTLRSGGIVLAGTTVGGDITDVELVSAETGYAIITDASFHNVLVRFNPSTGDVTATVYAPGEFVLQDIERAPTGELFLTDRSVTNPGIRLYNVETGAEITNIPIDVGLPPFQITFGVVR
jgi:hypothetical protein